MKNIALAAVAAFGLAGAVSAHADDSGWYIAGGLGGTSVAPLILDTQNALIAAGDTRFVYSANKGVGAARLQAGYQISTHLAVEGGFVHVGKFQYTATGGNLPAPYSFSTTIRATYMDAVGILPLGSQFSAFGKLGIAHTSSTAVTGAALPFAGRSRIGVNTGLGIKYEFSNGISLQYEGSSYDIGASSALSTGTFNLGYKF